MAISALGLAVAGSVTLTSGAESVAAEPAARPAVATSTATLTGPAPQGSKAQGSKTQGAKTPGASATTARSDAVERALAKERAAQRAEELAKTADRINSADRSAANAARQKKLSSAEQASQATAAKLAQEKLQRAADAREAAVTERLRAEATKKDADPKPATNAPTPAPDPSPTTPPVISSGGRGVDPVPGAVVGAHFGQYGLWSRYHTGLDFRAGYGTPIRAVMSGEVLYAGNSGDWAGNHVAIKHADGETTMSSHMSSMAVRPGQSVQAGQVIGYVGQTGRAFGAHLHFELYPVGVKYGDVYRAINPQPWLSLHGVNTR